MSNHTVSNTPENQISTIESNIMQNTTNNPVTSDNVQNTNNVPANAKSIVDMGREIMHVNEEQENQAPIVPCEQKAESLFVLNTKRKTTIVNYLQNSGDNESAITVKPRVAVTTITNTGKTLKETTRSAAAERSENDLVSRAQDNLIKERKEFNRAINGGFHALARDILRLHFTPAQTKGFYLMVEKFFTVVPVKIIEGEGENEKTVHSTKKVNPFLEPESMNKDNFTVLCVFAANPFVPTKEGLKPSKLSKQWVSNIAREYLEYFDVKYSIVEKEGLAEYVIHMKSAEDKAREKAARKAAYEAGLAQDARELNKTLATAQ
jgi:hypothetical protein